MLSIIRTYNLTVYIRNSDHHTQILVCLSIIVNLQQLRVAAHWQSIPVLYKYLPFVSNEHLEFLCCGRQRARAALRSAQKHSWGHPSIKWSPPKWLRGDHCSANLSVQNMGDGSLFISVVGGDLKVSLSCFIGAGWL